MALVQLTGGDYQGRDLIAAAQRCLNLVPEAVPQQQGEPSAFVHILTPGLLPLLATTVDFTVTGKPVRGLYTATNGQVFAVVGQTLYSVQLITAQTVTLVTIGNVSNAPTPVRMLDNGIVLVVVDGIVDNGWYVMLNQYPAKLTAISDPAWYGSTTVGYLDTFFLFNRPGTTDFYVSPSNWDGNASGNDAFDGNYIAAKTTLPDQLQAVAVAGQAIYLIGSTTSEIWYDSGAPDFPFQRVPGVLINHGTRAPYSVVVGSVPDGQAAVFWLGSDSAGNNLVFQGVGYQAARISTHAIEAAFSTYAVVADATAYCYQQDGHFFYVLNFPTQDVTWCFDATTELWHERSFTDAAGTQHAHRASCVTNGLGFILAGDAQNGQVYSLTKSALTDAGSPINRLRSFPHMQANGQRNIHRRFMLDMAAGSGQSVGVSLSDDRGATFTTPIEVGLGTTGNTYPTLWRLGMARDRVYQVSWSGAFETALIGASTKKSAARLMICRTRRILNRCTGR